jgi:hypothetical protein
MLSRGHRPHRCRRYAARKKQAAVTETAHYKLAATARVATVHA